MLSTSRSYLILDREDTLSLLPSPDYLTIEPEGPTASIGIEEVRTLKAWAAFKPFESKLKVALIKRAQNLTVEAQNAMLKLLEEPAERTVIVLTVDDEKNLLPTVTSRCARISNVEFLISKLEGVFIDSFPPSLRSSPSFSIPKEIGDRFAFAEDLASQGRETIVQTLSDWIKSLHQALQENENTAQIVQTIKEIEAARQAISKNANARLALENLMLKIN